MKKLFLIVLLLGGFASAQIGHYDNKADGTRYINGIPAATPYPLAQVLVCSYPGPCNGATAATIYTDSTGAAPAPNPFPADNDGNFGFWATSGLYQYTFTFNGVVHGPYPVSIGGGSGQGTQGAPGADGAPGANGYTPNQIISGCGVGYVSGFTWTIGACNYWLNNHQYSAPQATITGPSADSTFDRFDVIAVDASGVFSVVPGVAQASPAKPILDPSLQTEITFYRVNAGSTTPANVTVLDIYHENAEWTCSVSATMNCASTVNPHTGTKDVEATAAPQGAFARFTIPAGTLDIGTYRDLIWNIALKAPLNTHSLTFQWYNGTTPKCTPVNVLNGQFNFNESITSYQQIDIPLSTFNCSGIPVTRLQITVSGSSTSTVGFYLDDIYLQGGVTNGTANSGMQWLRTWNPTQVYKIQDTVTWQGSGYTAIAQGSGLDPTLHPEAWDAFDCHQPAGSDGNIQIKSGNCYAAINSSYDPSTQTVTFGGPVVAGGASNQGVTIKACTSGCTTSASQEIKIISSAGTCQISQNGGAFVNCSTAFSGGTAFIRRTCMIQVGDGTNTVASGDYSPFKTGACYVPYAATIVEINIQSDAGTPSVLLQRRRGASTVADLLSGALAAAGTTHTCALTGISGTCIDGTTSSGSITLSNTSLNAGDVIEVKSGTASTETSMRIAVVFTVN